MLMMTSQIFKSLDFTKTQKSRHLEKEALFSFQIKKFINSSIVNEGITALLNPRFFFHKKFHTHKKNKKRKKHKSKKSTKLK